MGNPFEKSSLKEVITSLMGVVGWGTLAQHTILGLYKTVLSFMGGFTTIPLVYAATYALGTDAKYPYDLISKLLDEAAKRNPNFDIKVLYG